jgi:hypothetical protein
MLDKLKDVLADEKSRDLALLAGGMLGVMSGAKVTPLAMAAVGLKGLERRWRAEHPEFEGDLRERWRLAIENYDATHRDPVNRVLHTVGIPMILGGVVGMMISPRWTPPWWIANGSWTAGWILNFIGHGVFEKNPPAFAQDPLSFLAGPAWDFVRLEQKVSSALRGAKAAKGDEASRAEAPASA